MYVRAHAQQMNVIKKRNKIDGNHQEPGVGGWNSAFNVRQIKRRRRCRDNDVYIGLQTPGSG